MRYLFQLISGLVFGVGLALAGMTSPQKVLAFLDVSGSWDPALLFVLGGAVVTAAIGFHWILKRRKPLFDQRFHLNPASKPDRALLLGSVLFGIGWGISGYCPGPAIALLAVPGNPESAIFLSGLASGIFLHFLFARQKAESSA
jgi:uncharacterized membrane protein YedE/YeeE